ncbi:MAG: RluA family pseudouridine synthase [Planctomycetota bacterium]
MNEQGRETTQQIVNDDLAGKTVLAILRTMRPGESWSQLRIQLRKACVSLNDIVCIDEARRVAAGDVIAVGEQPLAPPPQLAAVKIHFVDAHVVVVEKPSGMMTHRRPEERNWSAARRSHQPSLEEAVIELLVQRAVQHGHSRPRGNVVRCVHRLDRDTSGLIVFARTDEAEQSLVDQFRRHEVHRVYWSVVHGTPHDGTIVTHIARDRGDGRRGSSGNSKIGQRAVTHVRWMEQLGNYSLVECRLETGRTNQIRIHLSEKGHLVCGDVKYRQPFAAAAINDVSGAPRLALHASELGFVHPMSREEVFFTMPFPPDMERFVRRLSQR